MDTDLVLRRAKNPVYQHDASRSAVRFVSLLQSRPTLIGVVVSPKNVECVVLGITVDDAEDLLSSCLLLLAHGLAWSCDAVVKASVLEQQVLDSISLDSIIRSSFQVVVFR